MKGCAPWLQRVWVRTSSWPTTGRGTIAEGWLADFVVLSRDLLKITPREIRKTRPVLTVADGRVVSER